MFWFQISTDNRLMIWNNRPMSHSTGNLSAIYRRFPEIYRKNGNLFAVKSSDNLQMFFSNLPMGTTGNRFKIVSFQGGNRLIPVPEDVFCSPNLDVDSSNPANRNHKMVFAKKWIESISLAVSRRSQSRSTCYVLAQPPLGGSHV